MNNKVKEFKINKEEILRYLGYRGQEINEEINNIIEECRNEVKKLVNPRYIYEFYNVFRKDNEINIKNSNLVLKGEDIKKHLVFSDTCVLMAATIGSDVERKINLYERINLTKALVMDACATTAIEELCDYVENEIRDIVRRKCKNLNFRFSPGYGDLDIEIQKEFIKVIEANKKIGLTASSNNILFPRKSVTAIIGIINEDKFVKKRGCLECSNYNNCNFRKEGLNCGN